MVSVLSCQKTVPVNWLRKLESGTRSSMTFVFITSRTVCGCECLWQSHRGGKVRLWKPVWSQSTLHSNLLYKVLWGQHACAWYWGPLVHHTWESQDEPFIQTSGKFVRLCSRNGPGQSVPGCSGTAEGRACQPSCAISLHLGNFHLLLLQILIFLG